MSAFSLLNSEEVPRIDCQLKACDIEASGDALWTPCFMVQEEYF